MGDLHTCQTLRKCRVLGDNDMKRGMFLAEREREIFTCEEETGFPVQVGARRCARGQTIRLVRGVHGADVPRVL